MKTPTYLYARDGSSVLIDAVDVPEYIAKGYQDTQDFKESAPTRAELEQKAAELGIKFDGRTSDAKLLKLINEQV